MKSILKFSLALGMCSMQGARTSEFPINQQFTNRWSSRAFSKEIVTKKELMSLFEAARWAPSSYNSQPWKFVWARNGSPEFKKMFDCLVPFNQEWVKHSPILITILSKDTFDHNNEFSRTHSFDTGAAWANFALQASLNGIVAHGMSGFDYDKVKKELHAPEGYTVEAMVAVGKKGTKEDAPTKIRSMEKMSDRKPVSNFVFEGRFGK